ncbi:stage III sporulation protein AE [Selenihalanaerobacter shriftii]|uniref:Stage III sporulation protein AE n=1 Tax=Selenihalanaerobacter shriftii TaxID=142842 RepID=A0A1T4P4C4_9FIRM|nr:stage III sporulation protein AE [Selenihalanaerobacter shriftii]SJZ85778.1 stage III sporulation protein AE [Selenihalanaerobacter shriftii]
MEINKKVILVTIFIIVMSQLIVGQSWAQDREDVKNKNRQLMDNQLEKLDLKQIKEQIDKLNREAGEYLPKLTLNDVVNLFTNGEFNLKFKAIFTGMLKYLFKEIVVNFKLLGQLIILAVIAAVLKTFQNSFAQQDISRLVNSIVYLVLVIIALNSFKIAINVGVQAIDDMVSIMQALLPTLLTLLVAVGNITSAALFQPITFLIVNLLSVLIKNIIFPLILFSAILAVVNNISDNFNISGLVKLISEINVGLLGAFLTVFIGVLVVQGTAGAVGDGVTIRTAKYLSGAFVPVIGGIFADALDMIIGGSLLIKNALGLLGVIIIFLFCTFSLIKIIALIFIYKFAGAVIQPISDSKIVTCLNDLGNSLILVFASVLSVALMFFITLTILIGVANMTVMLR